MSVEELFEFYCTELERAQTGMWHRPLNDNLTRGKEVFGPSVSYIKMYEGLLEALIEMV